MNSQGQATRILPTALHQKAKQKNSPRYCCSLYLCAHSNLSSFPKKPKGETGIPADEVQFLEDALRSGTLKGILKLYSNYTQGEEKEFGVVVASYMELFSFVSWNYRRI
jgi:hypothetical protein